MRKVICSAVLDQLFDAGLESASARALNSHCDSGPVANDPHRTSAAEFAVEDPSRSMMW